MENLNKKNALVTGAAGFIGSHLCQKLTSNGYHVIALDLPDTDWWRHDLLNLNCDIIEVSLANADKLNDILNNKHFNCVFHLASYVNVERKIENIDSVIKNNIIASQNLLSLCKNITDRIVIAGTCEEYGNGVTPFEESQREIAVSPYSWSKICVTHLGELYARIFDLPVVLIRPFLTYGPLQINNMLMPDAIRTALNNKNFSMTKGEQTRDFNFVSDIVDGIIQAGFVKGIEGEIFNLGCGNEITIAEIVTKIYELCDSAGKPMIGDVPYRGGETMHFFCDNSKTRKILNWKPKVSLDEGLKQTIDWYKKYLTDTQ